MEEDRIRLSLHRIEEDIEDKGPRIHVWKAASHCFSPGGELLHSFIPKDV